MNNDILQKAEAVLGEVHYWSTGINGAKEPWRKTPQGWEKVQENVPLAGRVGTQPVKVSPVVREPELEENPVAKEPELEKNPVVGQPELKEGKDIGEKEKLGPVGVKKDEETTFVGKEEQEAREQLKKFEESGKEQQKLREKNYWKLPKARDQEPVASAKNRSLNPKEMFAGHRWSFCFPDTNTADAWEKMGSDLSRSKHLRSQLSKFSVREVGELFDYMDCAYASAALDYAPIDPEKWLEVDEALGELFYSPEQANEVFRGIGLDASNSKYKENLPLLARKLEILRLAGSRLRVPDEDEFHVQHEMKHIPLKTMKISIEDENFFKEENEDSDIGVEGIAGLYDTFERTIYVGVKTNDSFIHELAHGLDHQVGSAINTFQKWFASTLIRDTNEIKSFTEKLIADDAFTKRTEGYNEDYRDYVRFPSEVFARFVEQWISTKELEGLAKGNVTQYSGLSHPVQELWEDHSYWPKDGFEHFRKDFEQTSLARTLMEGLDKSFYLVFLKSFSNSTFERDNLFKSTTAVLGEVRMWATAPDHTLEAWRKTSDGWIKDVHSRPLSATDPQNTLHPDQARSEQRNIWRTYQDAHQSGRVETAKELFGSFDRHQQNYGLHIPPAELLGTKKIPEDEIIPHHEAEKEVIVPQEQEKTSSPVIKVKGTENPKLVSNEIHGNTQRLLHEHRIASSQLGDEDLSKQAQELLASHRQEYGVRLPEHEQELGRTETHLVSAEKDLGYKESERLSLEGKLAAYRKRNQDWVGKAAEGFNVIHNTRELVDFIRSPEGVKRFRDQVASFGEFRAKGDELLEMSVVDMKKKKWVIEPGDLSCNFERQMIVAGKRDLWSTVNSSYPVVYFENKAIRVLPEQRERGYSAQLHARQEDFFRAATAHLPDSTKDNVVCLLFADLDVGKYHWMTQGYRYRNNFQRVKHLNTIRDALVLLRKLDQAKSPDGIDPETKEPEFKMVVENVGDQFRLPRSKDGRVLRISDLGYKKEDLDVLQGTIEKAISEAEDENLDNDKKIEPWELLQLAPAGKTIYVKESEYMGGGQYIPCTLMKFLSLNGGDWEGIKHVHGMTPRNAESVKVGDQVRAEQSYRSLEKGKPWLWLGRRYFNELEKLGKSLSLSLISLLKAESAQMGEIHSWKTGPGGTPQQWRKDAQGWSPVGSASSGVMRTGAMQQPPSVPTGGTQVGYAYPQIGKEPMAEFSGWGEDIPESFGGQGEGSGKEVSPLSKFSEVKGTGEESEKELDKLKQQEIQQKRDEQKKQLRKKKHINIKPNQRGTVEWQQDRSAENPRQMFKGHTWSAGMPRSHMPAEWEQAKVIARDSVDFGKKKKMTDVEAEQMHHFFDASRAAAELGYPPLDPKNWEKQVKDFESWKPSEQDAMDICLAANLDVSQSKDKVSLKEFAKNLKLMEIGGGRPRGLDKDEFSMPHPETGEELSMPELKLSIEDPTLAYEQLSGKKSSFTFLRGLYSPEDNQLFIGVNTNDSFSHEFWHSLDYRLNKMHGEKGGSASESGTRGDMAEEIHGFVKKLLGDDRTVSRWENHGHHSKMVDYLKRPAEVFSRFAEQWTTYKMHDSVGRGNIPFIPNTCKQQSFFDQEGTSKSSGKYWTRGQFLSHLEAFENLSFVKKVMEHMDKSLFSLMSFRGVFDQLPDVPMIMDDDSVCLGN